MKALLLTILLVGCVEGSNQGYTEFVIKNSGVKVEYTNAYRIVCIENQQFIVYGVSRSSTMGTLLNADGTPKTCNNLELK